MSVRLTTYLNFKSNARDAMNFYKSVFGGTLTLSTFKEGGMSSGPDVDDLVMHSTLESDHAISLMGSDSPPGMPLTVGNNVGIALGGNDEPTLRGYWNKLSEGGTVAMPLEKAPWGDTFGMCTDKFGINWLVNISGS
jgi:PhnB protein